MAISKRYQCEFHRGGGGGSRLLLAAYLLAAAAATAVLLALALFIVYRPMKPQASVARAAVDRAAVLYDGLVAYASYRGEAVTPPARLPQVVQERGADVALSPVLGGGALVPVSADAVRALAAHGAARRVRLRFVVAGQVRYRAGPFKSGWRDLYVRSDTVVGLGADAAAGGGAGDVPLLEYPRCASMLESSVVGARSDEFC
ncbi:hypothetical protein ACQ4PT_030617 [Festuca glaucescens]